MKHRVSEFKCIEHLLKVMTNDRDESNWTEVKKVFKKLDWEQLWNAETLEDRFTWYNNTAYKGTIITENCSVDVWKLWKEAVNEAADSSTMSMGFENGYLSHEGASIIYMLEHANLPKEMKIKLGSSVLNTLTFEELFKSRVRAANETTLKVMEDVFNC